jgi:hypothetical protein
MSDAYIEQTSSRTGNGTRQDCRARRDDQPRQGVRQFGQMLRDGDSHNRESGCADRAQKSAHPVESV